MSGHCRGGLQCGSALAVAVAAVAALCAGAQNPVVAGHRPVLAWHVPAQSQLPAAASGPVSRLLGRLQPGYRVTSEAAALVAHNRAQHIVARFSRAGVMVHSGQVRVGLRLRGYGFGSRLTVVPAVAPLAAANRVSYRSGALTQWYANGPLGLEQGFTFTAPAVRRGRAAPDGELTLDLAVSGGAATTLAGGTVTFRRAGSSLAYRGLVVSDARGRRLPARIGTAGDQVLLRADVRGARYPVTVDPVFQQLAKITATGGLANDQFGTAVAIAGNVLAVGAPSANSGKGAVYVFTAAAGGWSAATQSAELTASDGTADDSLGLAVAIDGSTIVASAPNATVNGHLQTGAAYVFTEPAGGWRDEQQAAKLTASSPHDFDLLGFDVAISGGSIFAGAYGATVNGHAGAGAVYVFSEPGGGWPSQPVQTSTAELTASDAADGASLGQSVAAHGASLVAGAPFAVVDGHAGQGAVYVFTEPSGGWPDEPATDIQAKLTAGDGGPGDNLGSGVAVAGNIVVGGASGAVIDGHANQGAAYVYTEPAGGWADEPSTDIQAKLTATDGAAGDFLGGAVAMDGNMVVAAAPGAAVGAAAGQGAAYVYAEPAGGWSAATQTAKITASDGAAGDAFGTAAAVLGSTIVAGAPSARVGANSAQGAVYVYAQPAPPPRLTLTGLSSPRPGSRLRPGSLVPVSAAISYVGGLPVPGWLAAQLAADCDVTVRARGAQTLASHCMRYDSAARTFSYRWRLGTGTGRITLQVQLSYPYPETVRAQVTVTRSSQHG